MALFTAASHPNAMIIWGLEKFGNFSFIKVKYALFSCPVIRLLCIYPKEMKTCPYKDLLMEHEETQGKMEILSTL